MEWYDTTYVPQIQLRVYNSAPSCESQRVENVSRFAKQRSACPKVKVYTEQDQVTSLNEEFESLAASGYTHIVNMAGVFKDICYYCRCYNIVPLDEKILQQAMAAT